MSIEECKGACRAADQEAIAALLDGNGELAASGARSVAPAPGTCAVSSSGIVSSSVRGRGAVASRFDVTDRGPEAISRQAPVNENGGSPCPVVVRERRGERSIFSKVMIVAAPAKNKQAAPTIQRFHRPQRERSTVLVRVASPARARRFGNSGFCRIVGKLRQRRVGKAQQQEGERSQHRGS